MQTYKIPYNKHRYSDLSDPARRGVFRCKALNVDEAEKRVQDWRSLHDEDGVRVIPGGPRWHIGLIHYGDISSV